MEGNQFDQIYHEHYCYFSLIAVEKVFAHHGVTIFDIEEQPTHGGSLRIFGRHTEESPAETERMTAFRNRELEAGLDKMETYASFAEQVRETKRGALEFLINAAREGKQVVGYGAPGKGNTFLNFCGIKSDMIAYTVDRNPYKQGRYLPGSRIPIYHTDKIEETKPDIIVIMPWNFRDEIVKQLSYVGEWGGKLAVFIPKVELIEPGAA